MKIQRSTIQLLRFPFSFFLMPVFWFALSQLVDIDKWRAVLIFIILHLLVYPASNGYNSYMDRDTTAIGGLEHPPAPERQLFLVTLCMDLLALVLGLFVSYFFVLGLACYILASRAYSYRGIRLKKYPVAGYLTVIICQGALIFCLVYHGSHIRVPGLTDEQIHTPFEAMLASSLLIGGFYPLTQLYQHEADRKDGVRTISLMLGYKGTFLFAGVLYLLAFGMLAYYFMLSLEIKEFLALATCLLPVVVYFLIWARRVWKDPLQANYSNTMRMSLVGSICANLGFLLVLLMG